MKVIFYVSLYAVLAFFPATIIWIELQKVERYRDFTVPCVAIGIYIVALFLCVTYPHLSKGNNNESKE